MARHTIQVAPRAARDLAALDAPIRRRIGLRIDALADDPRPVGVKKLAGEDSLWRLRVGDYRILYEIQGRHLIVLVVRIGHRREVYR